VHLRRGDVLFHEFVDVSSLLLGRKACDVQCLFQKLLHSIVFSTVDDKIIGKNF